MNPKEEYSIQILQNEVGQVQIFGQKDYKEDYQAIIG